MNVPRNHKDDDTIPVKPYSLSLIVLSSAGAGLAAGLLICWLFCSNCCTQDDADIEVNNVSISQTATEKTLRT